MLKIKLRYNSSAVLFAIALAASSGMFSIAERHQTANTTFYRSDHVRPGFEADDSPRKSIFRRYGSPHASGNLVIEHTISSESIYSPPFASKFGNSGKKFKARAGRPVQL